MTKMRILLAMGVGAGLFLTGAVAQQQEAKPAMACCENMPAMNHQMPPMAPGMMHQMMMVHNDAAKLVDQLVVSFAAVEAAKDGKVRKQKLAEHGALLKELQTKLQQMGPMPADEDHNH